MQCVFNSLPLWQWQQKRGHPRRTAEPRVKDDTTLSPTKRHATPFYQLFISPSLQTTSNFLLARKPFKDKDEGSRAGGEGKKWGTSVPTTLREGHCLQAYPGRDEEGLNLPEPIHGDRERDLRETRTTKTVCDKAQAPQSKRSEIKCDIFHLFVNASLAAHSLGTTVGLLPS